MARIYEVSFPCVTVTSAQTLLYLTAPSTMCGRIRYASAVIADVDTNEQTYCTLQRITTLGTPTGTTVVPAKTSPGDAASSFTCKADITAAEPSYTADTEVGHEANPSLSGWRFQPLRPEEYMDIAPSASVGVRLRGAIASSTVVVRVVFEEIG